MTVEAQSFSKAVVKEIELNIGTKQTLNFDLKPGELTETIEVSADSLLVETTKSELGGVVTPVEVENLPLLNRTFAALSVIMPEARPAGNFDPTKTRVGNVASTAATAARWTSTWTAATTKTNVVGSLLQNFSYESIRSSKCSSTAGRREWPRRRRRRQRRHQVGDNDLTARSSPTSATRRGASSILR